MKTGRLFAGLAMAGILTGGSAFGQILVEDFNSGVFTSATTSRATFVNAEGTTVYNWAGTAAGDSFDGWSPLIDTSGGEQAAGTEIRLDGQFNAFGPQGANSMAGWGTADGNLSSLYAAQNDVPKSGWQKTVQLDASMGGARNAAGDALAFVLIYDAELAYIHQRGAVGRANAVVTLDGQSHNAHSPLFYRETISFDDTRDPPRWLAGDPWSFNFTPSAEDLIVEDLPVETLLNTDDSISGVDLVNGGAAHRGVSSGVIEQVVPNGADITVRFLHNRFNQRTTSPRSNWQWMNVAVDNVKLVALEAGDVNGDLQVDIDDASVLLTNFGTTSGATWTDGDFNGDGAVDIDDASLLLGNFGTSYSSPAAGEIEVTIDVANKQVIIEANEVALLRLEDPSGNIISYDPAVPFSTVNPVTPTLVGEFMLGDFITGTAVIGFENFENQEVIIGHQLLGQDRIDNTFILIPEPASLALLGLGGLALLRRRAA